MNVKFVKENGVQENEDMKYENYQKKYERIYLWDVKIIMENEKVVLWFEKRKYGRNFFEGKVNGIFYYNV